MVRGLYTSASGMMAQQYRMDVVANNLANVDTEGFKREIACLKAFPEMRLARTDDDGVVLCPLGSTDMRPYIGKLGTGVETNEVYTEFSEGSLKATENPLDFALEGEGFFAIQTPAGERYTRNGSFILDKDGYVVTKQGYRVLGEEGPIKIKANNFMVDESGQVFVNRDLEGDDKRLVQMTENDWSGSDRTDRLRIVRFDNERFLKKEGESQWAATEVSGEAMNAQVGINRPKVLQGHVESSNVNAVQEMVAMIEVQRAYELNSRSIMTHDTLIGKAVNEVGRTV